MTIAKPTCRVVNAGKESAGKQGHFCAPGISAQSAGARRIHLQIVRLPPGNRSKAHRHDGHETAIYILSGESGMWHGESLQHHLIARAGDFLYIPANVPHLPYNLSDAESCVAVIARTDPNEQESVVLLPELESRPDWRVRDMQMSMTPIERLYDRATRNPSGTAFIAADDKWTFKRFATEVHRVAHGLAARGIRTGDRIALHLPNCPELAVAVYACFHIGAIAVPLNNRFKGPELKAMLQRLQPALYVGNTDLYREVRALSSSIVPPERCFVVGSNGADGLAQRWTNLQNDPLGDVPMSSDIHAPALLLATSGTTGIPKFVIHTLSTVAVTAENTKYVGTDGSHTAIVACPMVHAAGLFSFIGCVHHGAQMVLFERFDPDAVLDAIEQHGCSWQLGLTFMWAAMLEAQRQRRRNVETLRFCVSAGDVCPPQLQREFGVEFGVPLYSTWGASEAIGSLTYGLQPGPISRIAPGAQVCLVDEAGATVCQGEVGELLLRGPNVSIGYWGGPDVIEGAPKNGWHRTGDLMRQDASSNLWFMGRKKDIIIRGGSNISPAEVEAVLRAHPAVQDAAVVGIPDDTLGQRVGGFVQLEHDAPAEIVNDILDAARTQLADYKMPERLQVVSSIPRNGLGKIDRKALPVPTADAGHGAVRKDEGRLGLLSAPS